MEFTEIEDFKNPEVDHIYKTYCSTFPEAERRSENQFKNLFDREDVKILSITEKQNSIGYLILWQLKDFTFLEHFEIFEEYRNKSFGSEILSSLKSIYLKIILETEPENLGEIASRRINFYKRNGFQIISDTYIQPSYGDGKPPISLILFASWDAQNADEIIKVIHQTVYQNVN